MPNTQKAFYTHFFHSTILNERNENSEQQMCFFSYVPAPYPVKEYSLRINCIPDTDLTSRYKIVHKAYICGYLLLYNKPPQTCQLDEEKSNKN